jgi:hypothetical protein
MKTIVEKLHQSTRGPLGLRTKPRSSYAAIIVQTYAILSGGDFRRSRWIKSVSFNLKLASTSTSTIEMWELF